MTLRSLVLMSYGLKSYQLIGDSALGADKFDIVAKVPSGAARAQINPMIENLLIERFGLAAHKEMRDLPIYELTIAKGGQKMKAPAPLPGSAPASDPNWPTPAAGEPPQAPKITFDKDGFLELAPGVPALRSVGMNGMMHVSGRMQTVAALLRTLSNQLGRPVVDKTGLTGTYDFAMVYAPDATGSLRLGPLPGSEQKAVEAGSPSDAASDPLPNLRAAMEAQLGLKLESKKGPVEVLVVDHVNRAPTEN